MIKKIGKIAVSSLINLLLILLLIAIFPYIFSNIYDFPERKEFSGNNFYNPYEDTVGNWYKANFQAHSGAWGGTTDGKVSPKELYDIYKRLGYDIVGLTNYQSITKPVLNDYSFIPMYEHGYNIKKRHQLLIGAKKVVWLDYIFVQTIHHKQDMLKVLRPTTEVITISHPKFSNSFEPSDFSKLTDYDFIEVLNHYRLSLPHWDSALSSGKLAWGMGNDDSHNQKDTNETGRYWNMVFAKNLSDKEIIQSLKYGRNYCVIGSHGINDNHLLSFTIKNDTLKLNLKNSASEIRFIGQNGDTLLKVLNSSTAIYVFKQKDTYLRAEVLNNNSTMYFNPVFRYTKEPLQKGSASVNYLYTWIYKIICLIFFSMILLLTYKRIRKSIKFYTRRSTRTPVK